MRQHTEKRVSCPHCGHSVSISLDTSNGSQDFYEDCPACCHTIHLDMVINEQFDRVELSIDADDEQIF